MSNLSEYNIRTRTTIVWEALKSSKTTNPWTLKFSVSYTKLLCRMKRSSHCLEINQSILLSSIGRFLHQTAQDILIESSKVILNYSKKDKMKTEYQIFCFKSRFWFPTHPYLWGSRINLLGKILKGLNSTHTII